MMKPPVDDIVARSFPKIKPQDATALYCQSKAEAKRMKKYPEWDCVRGTVAMSLLQAENELAVSERRLMDKKEVSMQKRKEYDEQWTELETKERELKESLRKFNEFVRENQEKRKRAERRIIEERRLQEKRHDDANQLRDEISHFTSIKTKMEQRIKEYRMYEDYLVRVANSTDTLKKPDDVLARYEALVDAKKLLLDSQQGFLGALDVAKSEMVRMVEEKSLIIVGLSNKLANLQSRYNAAKSNSLTMETLLAKAHEMSCEKLSEIIAVKTACYDMYKNMCGRLQVVPSLGPDDFEQHLLFIKRVLLNLKHVNSTAEELCRKERSSLKGEPSSKSQ